MPSTLASHWSLDPTITFLNHGSFGATPRAVLDAQSRLRAQMEAEPVRFFVRELPALLDAARAEVAAFVGAEPRDLGFVRNATSGVASVLASLRLAPGDELLTTSHVYGACRHALAHAAQRAGARVVVAEVPFPIRDEDEVLDAILAAAGPRTRLALVDHVTSASGLVLPIERIVRALDARGIDTLVDGAHAPGMLPLALDALGAAYYTGNFHKWVCAPKGAAMLHVRRDRQEGFHPAVISHGYASKRARGRFLEEMDWVGTDDPTSWLSVPVALRVMAELGGGWPALMAANHRLALDARRLLSERLGIDPPAPEAMIGTLVTLPLRSSAPALPSAFDVDPLQTALLERHRIEVPIFPFPAPPQRCVRVAAQCYLALEDFARLADALCAEGAR